MVTYPLSQHRNSQTYLAGDISSHLQSDYQDLMLYCSAQENGHALACILSSYKNCCSDMPDFLGLSFVDFNQMMSYHFKEARWHRETYSRYSSAVNDRKSEKQKILNLLWDYRANSMATTKWIATIIANGCMGEDHLWQDMGLWSRDDLSALIRNNFPALALKNDQNMKWKRFFYRILCDQGGCKVCRAPSCDVCIDYDVCFGEED